MPQTYQYSGAALDTTNWDRSFGTPPSQITASITLAKPFPEDPNFVGGWVGGLVPGPLTGILSASISDGVRTFTPDMVFLSGYGNSIREWLIGGGIPVQLANSDSREITTANLLIRGLTIAGDLATFELPNTPGPIKTATRTNSLGQWTVVKA